MRYFGTDGIRGRAYETLTESLAIKVGKSLSLIDSELVIIGYDTRQSNHMLANGIALGALSVNKKVIDVGVIPTPGIAFNSIKKHCIGIMITASHNPYQDNGIKIFYDGLKLDNELQQKIEEYIDEASDEVNVSLNLVKNDLSLVKRYEKFLLNIAYNTDLKIVLDTANGATYQVADNVFSKITNNLIVVANDPNGININENVGSTHIDNLVKEVVKNNADIGFSFDGDGDRMLVVDELGNVHTGDEIIYVLAKNKKEKKVLLNNSVVLTIMSNLGIISSLKDNNIDVVTTSVGDINVLEEMLKNNYILGGENSGHLIQLEYLPTGDGILAAISLLNVLIEENKKLSELTNNIKIYPDRLDNLKVKDKSVIKDQQVIDLVNNYKKQYEDIQLVVRASGTEDLVRVSCCYKDLNTMNEIVDSVVNLIKSLDK